MLAKYRAHQKRGPFRWTSRSPSVAQCKGWVYSSTIEKGRVFDAQHMANIRNISWGQCAVGPNPNLIATLSSRYFLRLLVEASVRLRWISWLHLTEIIKWHFYIWRSTSEIHSYQFLSQIWIQISWILRRFGFVIILRASSTNKSRSKVKQNFCRVHSCSYHRVFSNMESRSTFFWFFFFSWME